MKVFAITILLSALPAFAQGPEARPAKVETEDSILAAFRKDLANVEHALTSTNFETGPVARELGKGREQHLSAVKGSRAVVESLRTRVDEIAVHFAALRTGGGNSDNPTQLEAFCANNQIPDLSQSSLNLLIGLAYEREAATLAGVGALIEPVAEELFASNSAWAPSDVPLPSGYDPNSPSAREYVASQLEAQRKTHSARVAAHQRLRDAVTHSGWAASRVRQLKARALARVADVAPATVAVDRDPKEACRYAVARLRESQLLAGTSSGGNRAPAAQGLQKSAAPR